MSLTDNWHGRTLQAALTEQPSLSLDFYSYGVMLRKREGDAYSEYAVDPAQVAALSTRDPEEPLFTVCVIMRHICI